MWSRLLRWRVGPTATMPTTGRPLINRLPPEVLGHCFEFLALSDRVRAASVCGYWRSVALGHAELWCELDNVDMDALPDFLARTKRAGVRLFMQEVQNDSIDVLCHALGPHMGHMRHLDLELQPDRDRKDYSAFKDLIAAQAPLLETFSLVINGVRLILALELFGGVAPRLRSLRMEGWTFQTSTAATQTVQTLHAPGMLYTEGQATHPFYTSAWSQMFPNLRVLHLYYLSATAGLWGTANPFPTHLTTLVLEFSDRVSLDDAFALLQQANFTSLRELMLVNACPLLVDPVIQALDPIVSLELLDTCPRRVKTGFHIRLVTEAGRAVNFIDVPVSNRDIFNLTNLHLHLPSLEDVLFQSAPLFASLRELHIDRNVLGLSWTHTLAQITQTAPRIERLVLTGGAMILCPVHRGARDALPVVLRALRDLRIQGSPRTCISADTLADLVRALLGASPARPPPRLTLVGVEIHELEGDALSRAALDDVLSAYFAEVCVVPHGQTTAKTQRAEMFLAPIARLGSDSSDCQWSETEGSDSEDSGYWSPTPYGTYWQ